VPFKVRLRLLVRRLARLIAVIAVAGAAGVALGVGLSALTGGDSTDSTTNSSTSRVTSTRAQSATPSEPKLTARSVGHAATTTTDAATAKRRPSGSGVRVHVVSTVLHRGLTQLSRRRNRARLAVHVRVTNHGKRTIAHAEPLLVAGRRVRADPSAREATGPLLRPVRPESTVDGTLRFETTGAVTARLVSTSRARLRIVGQTVRLKVQIGRPVRPSS
jgi:hypothetical protein